MTTYAMVIDTRTCIGCGDCLVACKNENKVPAGLNRDWVVEARRGEYPDLHTEFRSERCNHCSHATCVTSCPTGASHDWRDTNIVLIAAQALSTLRAGYPGLAGLLQKVPGGGLLLDLCERWRRPTCAALRRRWPRSWRTSATTSAPRNWPTG